MLVETLQILETSINNTEPRNLSKVNPFLDEYGYLESEKIIPKSELPLHLQHGYVVVGESGSEYTTIGYDPITRNFIEGNGIVMRGEARVIYIGNQGKQE